MKEKIAIITQGVLLLLIQVLVLNNIALFGWFGMYIYVLFVIILPVSIKRIPLMLIAIAMSLLVDLFSPVTGIHTAATLPIAFLRPYIIGIFVTKEQMEKDIPSYKNFGISFYYYAITMVFIHHTILYLLDAFSWQQVGFTMIQVLGSVIFTTLLIVLYQSIKYSRK